MQQAYRVYRVGRWFLGAAIATAAGVFLFASGEPAAGTGAVVAGVGMVVIGVLLARAR